MASSPSERVPHSLWPIKLWFRCMMDYDWMKPNHVPKFTDSANENPEVGSVSDSRRFRTLAPAPSSPELQAMYFCAACNLYVRETSVSDHDQSTAHLLATTRAPTLRKVWLPESNRGYQLLTGMGWKEDAGLGPKGDGRVEPIATILKNDRAGLGMPHKPARITHAPPLDLAEKARRLAERRARKRKDTPDHLDISDPHNATVAQRKQLKLNEQQRDKDIAMELYAPDALEGYEAYLR